jgi:ribosomal-protein-alanine N-acetyltransferase
VSVRPATSADASAIRRLQSLLDDPAPRLLDAALNGLTGKLLVTTADGAVVGYALAVPGVDGHYLAELAVAPTVRRDGHGSRLVAAVAARGSGALQVTVAAADDRARAFYSALGFEAKERLPDRFDECDGLLLSWPA